MVVVFNYMLGLEFIYKCIMQSLPGFVGVELQSGILGGGTTNDQKGKQLRILAASVSSFFLRREKHYLNCNEGIFFTAIERGVF